MVSTILEVGGLALSTLLVVIELYGTVRRGDFHRYGRLSHRSRDCRARADDRERGWRVRRTR